SPWKLVTTAAGATGAANATAQNATAPATAPRTERSIKPLRRNGAHMIPSAPRAEQRHPRRSAADTPPQPVRRGSVTLLSSPSSGTPGEGDKLNLPRDWRTAL